MVKRSEGRPHAEEQMTENKRIFPRITRGGIYFAGSQKSEVDHRSSLALNTLVHSALTPSVWKPVLFEADGERTNL